MCLYIIMCDIGKSNWLCVQEIENKIKELEDKVGMKIIDREKIRMEIDNKAKTMEKKLGVGMGDGMKLRMEIEYKEQELEDKLGVCMGIDRYSKIFNCERGNC
eukprot:GHVR01166564.1.p1 GENE.GHVR01166564.1~~GHVR01166564.1.p1  ORF type:complete len:103 (+),score=28.18 GHVR01166564.1:331-639(+)